MRRVLLTCVLAVWAAFGLALAGSAHAEVRAMAIPDYPDATPTVSGIPNNPDLAGVTITYDNVTGTISVTQDFYNAFTAIDRSQNYAFFGFVEIEPASTEWKLNGLVEEEQCGYGGFSGRIADYPSEAGYKNSWTVGGYSGEAKFTTVLENGGRRVTAIASGPSLVGHDWRCANFVLMGNTRSTVTNLKSFYDGYCDCWALTVPLDAAGTTAVTASPPTSWFSGFPMAPRPKPESEAEKKAREKKEHEAAVQAEKKDHEAAESAAHKKRLEAKERQKEMTLRAAAAEGDLGVALGREFGQAFKRGSSKMITCGEKVNRSERRCGVYFEGGPRFHAGHPVNWFDHRYAYRGTAIIWLKPESRNLVSWNYSWKLMRIDERCALTRATKACTKRFVVH